MWKTFIIDLSEYEKERVLREYPDQNEFFKQANSRRILFEYFVNKTLSKPIRIADREINLSSIALEYLYAKGKYTETVLSDSETSSIDKYKFSSGFEEKQYSEKLGSLLKLGRDNYAMLCETIAMESDPVLLKLLRENLFSGGEAGNLEKLTRDLDSRISLLERKNEKATFTLSSLS